MKNFDERQEQVRGRIMTRAFLITIILMLLAAFLNDMHLYDFEKNVGFGETLISIVCIAITYGSVASILRGSYFGPLKDGRMAFIAYVFTALSVVLAALTIFDLIRGVTLAVMNIISLLMVFSISISLWIRRTDWKK